MPGQRIKFRGAYEPYVIGSATPPDFLPWRGSRRPRFKEIVTNDDPARRCIRCRRPISVDGRMYLNRAGQGLHELCPG